MNILDEESHSCDSVSTQDTLRRESETAQPGNVGAESVGKQLAAASKDRRKTPEAKRNNRGKPKLSYMFDFPNAIIAHARVCEMGARKYSKHNWKKGLLFSEVEDSALRHMLDFHQGKNLDSESKLLHLGHAMWNIMALIEFHTESFGCDDRDNKGIGDAR